MFDVRSRLSPNSTHIPYTTLFRSLDGGQQVFTSAETKVSEAIFAAANHLGLQLSFPRDDALSGADLAAWAQDPLRRARDRKSTRLNSSHVAISYAVFCLKKKITYA